ncbi:unnamed protein product [Orchesella dallaii]|uniref:Uncharacterized protein n=1 Tax=Orchesella dallaii TaxID=48710 RepID=A0ABP1S9L2_9HEXA
MALTEALAEFTEFYLGWNQVDPKLAEARIMVELQSSLMKDADFYKVQRDYRRKGAPLLRMLEGILTEEGFRDGLREYIKKTTHGNQVTTTEFIQILQEAAGNRSQVPEEFSLKQVLKRFLDNTGYPLVRVAVENSTHFVLTQEKFLANEKGVWYIPIKLKIGREEVRNVWLTPDGKPLYVPGNTLDFILIDPDVRGYYSVIYEDNLLDRLKQQLATSENAEFSPLAKSRLLLDYFSFADKNVTSYDTPLTLSSYLSPDDDEPNYTVWLAFLWKFRSDAVRPFLGHPEFPTVHAYFTSKLDPLLLELENELPSPYVTFLRHWMLKYSCRYRTSYCLTLAQNIFSLWHSTPNSTLSSFSSHFKGISDKTMECLIISAGGMSEFSFILQKYNNLKKKLPQSLTCTRDPQLIEILLVKLIDPSHPSLPPKLRRNMLANLIDNEGRGEVLSFLSTNFDSVVELIGNGDVEIILFSLYRLVEYFCTPLQLQQLDIFVELHRAELERYDGGNGKWVLRKLYEVVNKNIEWMDNKGRKILGWIETSTHSNYEFIIDNIEL